MGRATAASYEKHVAPAKRGIGPDDRPGSGRECGPRGGSRYPARMPATPDAAFEPTSDDVALVSALRLGDERVFAAVVEQLNGPLLRLARLYVPSSAAAEEVVQDTWLGVVRGLGRFEARASFRTWVFRIATNRAMTRGRRERRDIPLSVLLDPADDPGGPAVDPERFLAPGSSGRVTGPSRRNAGRLMSRRTWRPRRRGP